MRLRNCLLKGIRIQYQQIISRMLWIKYVKRLNNLSNTNSALGRIYNNLHSFIYTFLEIKCWGLGNRGQMAPAKLKCANQATLNTLLTFYSHCECRLGGLIKFFLRQSSGKARCSCQVFGSFHFSLQINSKCFFSSLVTADLLNMW